MNSYVLSIFRYVLAALLLINLLYLLKPILFTKYYIFPHGIPERATFKKIKWYLMTLVILI